MRESTGTVADRQKLRVAYGRPIVGQRSAEHGPSIIYDWVRCRFCDLQWKDCQAKQWPIVSISNVKIPRNINEEKNDLVCFGSENNRCNS